MLEIITVEQSPETLEYNNHFWKDLLIDSYNKFHKHNDYKYSIYKDARTSLDAFWELLDVSEVHVVMKSNKFIGFFINTKHRDNNEISFKVFSHPMSCPMSLRSITKAALFRSFMLFIEDLDTYSELEFTTWHPSLVTLIKNFIPDLEITMINSSYIVCYKKVTSKDISSFKTTISKYLEIVEHPNKNKFKILY